MRRFLVLAVTMAAYTGSMPVFAQDAATPPSAQAQPTVAEVFLKPEPVEDKPLLIIRFNQPRVNFDNALSKAISTAEKIKPDMRYEVVSFVPERSNPATSRLNLQAVVGGMQRYGADVNRISWRSELSNTGFQEIYVNIQ